MTKHNSSWLPESMDNLGWEKPGPFCLRKLLLVNMWLSTWMLLKWWQFVNLKCMFEWVSSFYFCVETEIRVHHFFNWLQRQPNVSFLHSANRLWDVDILRVNRRISLGYELKNSLKMEVVSLHFLCTCPELCGLFLVLFCSKSSSNRAHRVVFLVWNCWNFGQIELQSGESTQIIDTKRLRGQSVKSWTENV